MLSGQIGRLHPDGRSHSGLGRCDDVLDSETLGDTDHMHRARPTEGDQEMITRIEPALDGDDVDGRRHVRIRDLVDRPGRPDDTRPEWSRDLTFDGLSGRLGVQGHRASCESLRGEITQNEIRVGHRRSRAAAAITNGTGVGSR